MDKAYNQENIERYTKILLSRLLLIRSDLEIVNKNYLKEPTRTDFQALQSQVESIIKNLIPKNAEKYK